MGAVEKVSTAFNRSTIWYIILESVRDVRNVVDRQDFFLLVEIYWYIEQGMIINYLFDNSLINILFKNSS